MSEHSEHYHDADRNKPLPGATVSSKEEVLQTLLDAARGEITALTEANKLLAAQVAGDGSSTDWRIYHSALSQCADLLDNMADNDALVDTPKYLALKLASAQAVPVAASVGDDPQFKRKLATYWQTGSDESRAALIDHLDSRAAKVSARAADAPSELAELVEPIFTSWDGCKYDSIDIGAALRADFKTFVFGKSRAADALDSQPTDQETRERIRNAVITCGHAIEDKSVKLYRDPKFPGGALSQLTDRIVLAISGFSSQPTDGEVRNG